MEAFVFKEAIQCVISLNLDRIIFESNSFRVVRTFHSAAIGMSEFYTIIRDVQFLLYNFPNFEVKFIKRQANMVAHSLAKSANSWARRSIMHVISPCIELFVMNDKTKQKSYIVGTKICFCFFTKICIEP